MARIIEVFEEGVAREEAVRIVRARHPGCSVLWREEVLEVRKRWRGEVIRQDQAEAERLRKRWQGYCWIREALDRRYKPRMLIETLPGSGLERWEWSRFLH